MAPGSSAAFAQGLETSGTNGGMLSRAPLAGRMPAESSGFRSDPGFPLGPLPSDLRATEPPRAAARPPIRRIEIVPAAPAQPEAAQRPTAAPVAQPEALVEPAPASGARAGPPRREPRPVATLPGAESTTSPPAPAMAADPPLMPPAAPPPPPERTRVILVAPPEPGLQPLGDGSGLWYYRDQISEVGRARRR